MDSYSPLVKKTMIISLFFLSFCLLGWLFFPPFRAGFAGLALGAAVSVINYFYLAWKVAKIAEVASGSRTGRVGLGFLTRASLAVLAVAISLKFPSVDLVATLAGLFCTHLTTLLLGIFTRCQQQS